MNIPITKATPKANQVSRLYWNIKERQIKIDKIGNKGTSGVLN
jgi:hypothetical protein